MADGAATVADLLASKEKKQIIATDETATLAEAAGILTRNRIGLLLVIDKNKGFRGLLSERDVVKALAQRGAEAAATTVGDVATHTVRACDPTRTLQSVLQTMEEGHFRHMPVVEGGQIRGVLSITDILKFLKG
jgi:CBS domain-containing protein